MEKLSDYLPLFIILVSFLFSILGKKRKKEVITQETMLPDKKPGEFANDKRSPEISKPVYREIVSEKPAKSTFHKPETEKSRGKVPPSNASSNVVEEDENSLFLFEKEDDVKRAIIYAEIFNRKEY